MKSDKSSVVIVVLRQPRATDNDKKRSDPFWEFGSFGLTGCHQRNLLHPQKCQRLNGVRLAFAQGGPLGFRLVYLTPPVTSTAYADRSEVRWLPAAMPFRYSHAPVLIDSKGHSDVPSLRDLITNVNRNGWDGKFASKFRTRCQLLSDSMSAELIDAYESRLQQAKRSLEVRAFASRYEDALPKNPSVCDLERSKTYRKLKLAAANTGNSQRGLIALLATELAAADSLTAKRAATAAGTAQLIR